MLAVQVLQDALFVWHVDCDVKIELIGSTGYPYHFRVTQLSSDYTAHTSHSPAVANNGVFTVAFHALCY